MKQNHLPHKASSGFKIPQNYLGDFEDRMLHLAGMTNNNTGKSSSPFRKPEDYFEHFEDRLYQRLSEENHQSKVISLIANRYFSYAAGFGAVIAVIFSLQFFDQSKTTGYDDLEITAVENYLLEKLDLTTPEESHFIKEGDFSFATPSNSNLNHEAVLDYLNESTEDPSLLLNEH